MTQVVPLKIIGGETIPLKVNGAETIPVQLEQLRVVYRDVPAYDGPYTVTPGEDAQMLETNGKRMTDNVVVGAIPSNYGLVTWNGSVLTIS